eukprot:2040065-Pleurochrysis_carterae.AAC.1
MTRREKRAMCVHACARRRRDGLHEHWYRGHQFVPFFRHCRRAHASTAAAPPAVAPTTAATSTAGPRASAGTTLPRRRHQLPRDHQAQQPVSLAAGEHRLVSTLQGGAEQREHARLPERLAKKGDLSNLLRDTAVLQDEQSDTHGAPMQHQIFTWPRNYLQH